MRKNIILSSIIIGICFLMPHNALAINPIIQTKFTADPAPMVYNDTVFLYTSHDEDDATGFKMMNWMLYTSTDMVNWTDQGIVASLKDFQWVNTTNGAWAPQCIYRNEKFYFYCPMPNGVGIGVLVSDSPYGPFVDPIGKPLIKNSNADIDPTVLIDDDGQAYLYWGNPRVYYVELNDDMVSYSGEIKQDPTTPRNYQEGPWVHKRNGLYYLAYASTCCPEGIGYAMSNSPTGPWEYKGLIMAPNRKSSGNHPGIIDYKGKTYVFGFNYAINFSLTDIHRERRSICVAEMIYNEDGTINELPWWKEEGAPQIEALNPYIRAEAETMAWEEGVETEKKGIKDLYVTNIENGDYIMVKGVDFGETGAGVFKAKVASAINGGTIELHIDSLNGEKIASLPVSNTGGWENWRTESASVTNAKKIHDLYLVFKGNGDEKLFNVDYWMFEEKQKKSNLVAVNATVKKFKIDTVSGNNQLKLSAIAIYSDGKQKDIVSSAKISMDKNGIVQVNDGLIKGVGYGLVNVALEYKGASDTVKVLVKSYKDEHTVSKINADKKVMSLYNEDKVNISIMAEFVDVHLIDITDVAKYQSSNPEILNVTKGEVETKSTGSAIIHVKHTDEFGNVSSTQIEVKVLNRDPYIKTKAADFNAQSGVQVEVCSDVDGGESIGYIENGDWIKFSSVDFGEGAKSFQSRLSSPSEGGIIEIHLDGVDGEVVGRLIVKGTGSWQNWVTSSCEITEANGVHDLYLKFTGNRGYLFNFNWWKFEND